MYRNRHRQRGQVVGAMDSISGGRGFESHSKRWCCSRSPKFNSSATFVIISQLVFLLPCSYVLLCSFTILVSVFVHTGTEKPNSGSGQKVFTVIIKYRNFKEKCTQSVRHRQRILKTLPFFLMLILSNSTS